MILKSSHPIKINNPEKPYIDSVKTQVAEADQSVLIADDESIKITSEYKSGEEEALNKFFDRGLEREEERPTFTSRCVAYFPSNARRIELKSLKLLIICLLVLPAVTAKGERFIKAVKTIKTRTRKNLSTKLLEQLLML